MAIDTRNLDQALAQLRSASALAQGKPTESASAVRGADFSQALKTAIDQVSQAQHQAEDLQKAFVLGDDKVSLSDTMIAMQKANISFQTAVQVRNKVVAAYNDIMNMQL